MCCILDARIRPKHAVNADADIDIQQEIEICHSEVAVDDCDVVVVLDKTDRSIDRDSCLSNPPFPPARANTVPLIYAQTVRVLSKKYAGFV